VGRAADTRDLTPAQCAVLAERFMRVILSRPAWLAKHDRGMADGLRSVSGRKALLDAFGASPRHYRRAKGLHDDESLQAVFDLRISLDSAFSIRGLSTARRRRIIALPIPQQKAAVDRAIRRIKATAKRRPTVWLSYSEADREHVQLYWKPLLDRLRSMKL
jgi:hypothetical protein